MGDECYVCFKAMGDDSRRPCACTKALAKVHFECIETHVIMNNKTKCEFCKTPYKIKWRRSKTFYMDLCIKTWWLVAAIVLYIYALVTIDMRRIPQYYREGFSWTSIGLYYSTFFGEPKFLFFMIEYTREKAKTAYIRRLIPYCGA